MLDKKSFEDNMYLIKDIRKAFDTSNWQYIIKEFVQFGFDQMFCDWNIIIRHSSKLSIMINWKVVGFFLSRGVRQEHHVRPLIFCIVKEAHSRQLSLLVDRGKLTCISVGKKNISNDTFCRLSYDILQRY